MYRDSSYIKTPKTSRRVQISIFNNFITNRYNALVYVFLLIDVLTLRFLHCNSFKFFSSTILQFFDNSKQINKLKRKLSIFQIFALLCGGGLVGGMCGAVKMWKWFKIGFCVGRVGWKITLHLGCGRNVGRVGLCNMILAIHNIATSKVETGIQQKNYV